MRAMNRWSGSAVVALVSGLALAALALSGTGAEPGRDGPGAVSVEQWFLLDDGSFVRVNLLVDTRLADPEEVLNDLIAESPAQPLGSVGAAFIINYKWSPSDIPVTVKYNDNLDPPGVDGEGDLQFAVGTWNSVPAQSFEFAGGGSTGKTPGECTTTPVDGENTIVFSDDLSLGTLGSTCSHYSTMTTVDGYKRTFEFDMRLDAGTAWASGGDSPSFFEYDLRTVLVHELGHALGLGHTTDSTANMYPFIGAGNVIPLGQDDIDGLYELYGTGAPPPPATPTRTATVAVTPTYAYRGFAPGVARNGAGSAPPATPTLSGGDVSQVSDGNEAAIFANDIKTARLTSGPGGVDVYLEAWNGFSFAEPEPGNDSYMSLTLYFGDTGFADDDLYIDVSASGIAVFRTTGSDFDLIHSQASPGTANPMVFTLPLWLFDGEPEAAWEATGAEAHAGADYDYDFVPDVLVPLPLLALP